ncbi:hypothetical protein FSP39_013441, partial [Pinctada imbricata]
REARRGFPKETLAEATDEWPKWKIGLAVGAPIALVLGGLWYYRRKSTRSGKNKADARKSKNVSNAGKSESRNLNSTLSPEKDVPENSEDQTPLEKAVAQKNKGNKYFKGGKYDQAINCYTEAIGVCPPENKEELSTFYQNRAAAYEKLKNTKMVVEDCTAALELNKKYIKALSRRSLASEQLGQMTQALEDVTALCILEGFQNHQSLVNADRILKKLGQSKAKEAYKKQKPSLSSAHFIRTYFQAFVNDPIMNEVKDLHKAEQGEGQVQNGVTEEEGRESKESFYTEALRKLSSQEYSPIIDLCTKEIAIEDSPKMSLALLLRATMYFLSNQNEKALKDLNDILLTETVDKRIKVNALIKRGTIYIQQEKRTEGLDDFATAVRIDPDNADIYHHRGHHNIQLERTDDAIRDLDNAIAKCPTFAASYVQKSFAEHKRQAVQLAEMNLPLPQTVIQGYKQNVEMFPDYGDARALYAQALGDAQKFDEADKQFEKALELDPDNATALVHRALLQLQWKQNVEEAVKMINKAVDIDNKCEYAYEVLGTLEVQRGNMDQAMKHFQKAIQLAKTENEMAHLFSLLEAAQAQLNVAKNLGIPLPNALGAMR